MFVAILLYFKALFMVSCGINQSLLDITLNKSYVREKKKNQTHAFLILALACK